MIAKIRESDDVVQIRWIPRYEKCERILHWIHTAAFFPLTATGLVLFIPWLMPLAQGDAGLIFRLVHRFAAVFFVFVPIIYSICRPRRLLATLRDIRFGKNDFAWLKAAPGYYLLGKHEAMPPQGRFNTGEKLNVLFMVSGTILFSITGTVMWFGKGIVPMGLFNAMVIVHVVAMILTVNMFIVHFYLAVAHPLMWQSLVSMRFGVVSESYAREHHAAWYYGEERATKLYEERKAAEATKHEPAETV